MNALLWAAVLVLVGLGVLVLEVFVPSGGILGFVSVVALVAGIATAFLEHGLVAGMSVLAVVVLAVPAVLGLAFRWFPETPLGRRVLPPPPDAASLVPDQSRRARARGLVGRRGRAVSELLPWGAVEVDGVEVEARSEGGPIEAGAAVEVTAAQGPAVVVRPADPAPRSSSRPGPERTAADDPQGTSGLSPTLESFDFDGLDDRG
jgi:membrane-bound ClpP family serine protease